MVGVDCCCVFSVATQIIGEKEPCFHLASKISYATPITRLTFLFLSTASVTGEDPFVHLLRRFRVVYSCSFCSMCNVWLLNLLANRSLEVDMIMYIHLIIF